MSGHPSWWQLPATAPGIPTLLVSTAFTADSYSVHLSDLANVWVESLDRKPIIKRGLVEDTSIDPSDGPDQIRKMLELLRASFDDSDPEHPNTSLTLARGDDGDSLVVHVTCLLPNPLKPFKWPMHLKKCPQSSMASELVLPLIQAHEARTREIDELVSVLREKDAVITRLIDKLEATGTGLEHVFNALSGKRRVSRAVAEGKVKGLAQFSEAEFRGKAAELRPVTRPSDVSALLNSVFGGGLQYKSDLDLEASTALNDWWTKLGKGKNVILSHRSEKQEAEKPPTPQPVEAPKDDDDDFQVQATPPRARKIANAAKAPVVDDDETSDGEDDVEPSPPRHKAAPLPRASPARLGAVGSRKRPSPSPPPAKSSQTAGKAKSAPSDAGSETASETEDEELQHAPPSSPPKPAPKRGGLGRIGGKPKQEAPAAKATRSPSPAASTEEPNPLPRRGKLGMIGKKAASPTLEATSTSMSDDGRGRTKTPAAESKKEQHRETSQERADRKRAELQKEMERRAAAGPAKKKRKF